MSNNHQVSRLEKCTTEDLIYLLNHYEAEDVRPLNVEMYQYLKHEQRFRIEELEAPFFLIHHMINKEFNNEASIFSNNFNTRMYLWFKITYGFKMFQVNILDSSTEISCYELSEIYDRIIEYHREYFGLTNQLFENVDQRFKNILKYQKKDAPAKEKMKLFYRVANKYPEFIPQLRSTYMEMKTKIRNLCNEVLKDKRTFELLEEVHILQKLLNLLDPHEHRELINGVFIYLLDNLLPKNKSHYKELSKLYEKFMKNHYKEEPQKSNIVKLYPTPRIVKAKIKGRDQVELNMTYTEFAQLVKFLLKRDWVRKSSDIPTKQISQALYQRFILLKKNEKSSQASFYEILRRELTSEVVVEPKCSNEILMEIINILNSMPCFVHN